MLTSSRCPAALVVEGRAAKGPAGHGTKDLSGTFNSDLSVPGCGEFCLGCVLEASLRGENEDTLPVVLDCFS